MDTRTSTLFDLAIFLRKTATVDESWASVWAAMCDTCICGQAVLSVIWLYFCAIVEVGKVENMKNRTEGRFGKG
jgi:hypothetical protein